MTNVIDLPEKLDTALAPGLAQRLQESDADPLLVDGQRVQSLGTLCAQALLVAKLAAEREGRGFQLSVSEAMRDDLSLLGLDALLTAPGQITQGDVP